MRLATYALRGRPSFGAVVGDGIVDLRPRLHRFQSLSEVFRAQALDQARAAATGVRPDVTLSEVELLAPLPAPEKILCIGINYANRGADYNVTNNPKYPSMFYRAPNSLVGSGQNLIRPKISEQLDYEGEIAIVIGRDCKHVAKDRALEVIGGITLANEGTIRDWTRHGQFNVTQGKNFDASGGIGPWIRPVRPDQAAAPYRAQERRGDAGRHHGEHDLLLRRYHRLYDELHDAQGRRRHLHGNAGQEDQSRSADLAQAGRHHRGRVPRDRRLKQYRRG